MENDYTYIRIKDSNGGIKQVARFLEAIPEQFNALLNLTDLANDLGLIVEKITAKEYENFSILEDEKGIKELTDLLIPKNKDNFETGGEIEKPSIKNRIFKTYSYQSPVKNLNMETIIFESPIYKQVRIKPTALGDEFLLKFKLLGLFETYIKHIMILKHNIQYIFIATIMFHTLVEVEIQ